MSDINPVLIAIIAVAIAFFLLSGLRKPARAADSILISPESVKRRRTAPAEEPCDDCAVDAKPSVT